MKAFKTLSLILIMTFAMSACTPTGNKDGVVPGDPGRVFAEPAVFDPEAPLVSPGAAALGILARWEPGVAGMQGEVEAAERAALDAFMQELAAQTGSDTALAVRAARPGRVGQASLASAGLVPVTYHIAPFPQAGELDTAHDASLVAGLVTGLGQIISDKMPAGTNVTPTQTTQDGDTAVTVSGDIGRSADGSSKFGLGLKTETVKNGAVTSTDMNGSVDGQRCPNAEGQVSFTVKVRLGAEFGGVRLHARVDRLCAGGGG